VASLISDIPGLEDVFHGIVIAGPSVNIKPDYVKTAQYGLTPDDIQNQLELETEGIVMGYVIEGEYLPNFRIAYHDSTHLDIDRVKKEKIFLPDGRLIPLSRVANISISRGSAEILRENLQNEGIVTARLNQVDLGTAIQKIQATINANISLPQGYYIEYGGEYQEQQQSFKELLTILIVAILLVFSVTLMLFREFKASLILIMISVLGVAGGYIALYLTNTPLNVGSYTGLIMIVGIIGENAIFTYQQYKKSFLESGDVYGAITYAISTRLRPKLMTALCAITAMLPLALGIGAGAQLHQPLAISVIGGFIVALPLLLIVLPGFLGIINRK
jgi:Cu/Ag efflux pump CusA